VLNYCLRRLAWMIPTMIGITLVVFVAVHAAPGDPALIRFGTGESTASSEDLAAERARFRAEYLLDRPLAVQYLHFLGPFDLGANGHPWFGGDGSDPWHGVLALDFGNEFQRSGMPVLEEIGRRLAVTIPLSLAAIVLSYAIALPLGVLSAVRRRSALDRATSVGIFALHSIPTFWAGLVLILLFGASGLGWLPVIGLHDKDADSLPPIEYALDTLVHCILPVATLTYGGLAYLSRQMRAGMIDVIGQDYVRTARAKGLPERTVIWKHAMRNALIPVTTLFATVLPALIGGSVIVETVFGLPGMGSYAYEGLLARDHNVIMATTTLSAAMTLLGILLSDILYALLDPRIRHG
jgi:peptide/nickel transport system permease protein